MEEGAIRTSGEGVSTRNAEHMHGMVDYIQRKGGNERTWMMGIVGMEERPSSKVFITFSAKAPVTRDVNYVTVVIV